MKKIDTVIFDLGGVLIDWNPDYVYTSIFSTDEDRLGFYRDICTPDWNEEQDAGRSLSDATELLVNKFPEHETNIRIYYDRWEEMLRGPVEGTVEILRQLRYETSHKLYALTNWSAETFPIALARYDFLHWFDGRVVSGEEKTRKPFIEIYETLIKRFDIDPTRSVYVDDNARNLAPASLLEMQTIHFQSPDQFKAELQKLQVL